MVGYKIEGRQTIFPFHFTAGGVFGDWGISRCFFCGRTKNLFVTL